MTEPRPLAQETDDALTRALLESAARDEAPADIPAKVAAAVGVSLSSVLAAGSAGAVIAAGSAKAGVGVAGFVKIVAISAAVSTAALFGGGLVVERIASRDTAAVSASAVGARVEASPDGAPAAAVSGALHEAPSLGEAAAAASAGARAPSDPRGAPAAQGPALDGETPSSSPGVAAGVPTQAFPDAASEPAPSAGRSAQLEEEVVLLDGARRALAGGHPGQALWYLEQHRTRIPNGALGPESVVLRVQALLATGRRADAEQAAQPILSAAPASGHAARIRELLAPRPAGR